MGIVILLWEKSQQGSKDIHFHGAGIGINAYYCSTCSSRFLPQLCPPLECIIASGSATLMPSFSGVTEPPSLVKQHWMNWDTTRLFCTHFSSSHSIGGKVLTLLLRIAHSMVHIKNEHRWHIRLSELPREPCWLYHHCFMNWVQPELPFNTWLTRYCPTKAKFRDRPKFPVFRLNHHPGLYVCTGWRWSSQILY